MNQPGMSSQKPSHGDRFPVLDTMLRRKRLYADPRVIAFKRDSIALDEAEWVSYTATQVATKRFMYPTSHHGEWEFNIGTGPFYGGKRIIVYFHESGRQSENPPEWTFLVNLVRQYLEPRLLAEMIDQVRSGETITIGGSLKVNRSGVACVKPRRSLPWESISGVEEYNGAVWFYQRGVDKPVLNVPMLNPNASLILDLLPAIAS